MSYQSFDVTYNSKTITFTYSDSGAPTGTLDYPTIFVIHGYTFHSGTFKKLTPLASDYGLRFVYINRRGYQGSTAYDATELAVLTGGDATERIDFLNTEGVYLALLVDGLTQELTLPSGGRVAVLGWSLGTEFALAFMTSMGSDMDSAVKTRLQSRINSVILLEPVNDTVGVPAPPGAYSPFTDPSVPDYDRNNAFFRWISGYFLHGDLSTRDFAVLEQVTPDPTRPNTLERMTGEDLIDISEIANGPPAEVALALPMWTDTTADVVNRSIFDPDLHTHWPNIDRNWVIYGSSSPWSIIYPAWQLQERAEETTRPRLGFRLFKGANHFAMWDKPVRLIKHLARTQGIEVSEDKEDTEADPVLYE